MSFRQTVAQQEGDLVSTERSEWRNLIILNISEYNRICIDIIVKQQIRHLEGGTTERSTVYDDM